MNQSVPLISPFLRLKLRALAVLGLLVLFGVLAIISVAVIVEWLVGLPGP